MCFIQCDREQDMMKPSSVREPQMKGHSHTNCTLSKEVSKGEAFPPCSNEMLSSPEKTEHRSETTFPSQLTVKKIKIKKWGGGENKKRRDHLRLWYSWNTLPEQSYNTAALVA